MPKVTVIIPAWGNVPFLERAIQSVRNQTYSGVEVLIIAPPIDGPQTLPAARKAGLLKATTEWVMFCDADDWIEPTTVDEMMSAAEREHADCVCCGMFRDRNDGTSILRLFDKVGPSDTYNAVVNKLFKKELFKDIILDEEVSLGEDLMISGQVLAKAKKVSVLNKAFYHYCENTTSITHSQSGLKRVHDLARVNQILRNVLADSKYSDFHDRVTRDVLLLWLRYRVFDRRLWRELRGQMRSKIFSDPRHGLIKKGALTIASCLFD